MQIEALRIENFGPIKNFGAKFCDKLNVICSEFWPDILAVLGLVAGSKVVGFNFTRHAFTQNTRIYASISGNFGKAEVELFYDSESAHCCADKIILNGSSSSFKELRASIGASLEEECAVYINADDFRKFVPFAEYDFARKLNLYLNFTPQKGNSDIMGIPQLKEVLRGFISSFEQIPINSSKDMWLSITKDGVFVPLWHGEVRHDLSTTERAIFNYLCFVKVNAFWGQATHRCNLIEQLPLFIGDFICCIDEAADITPLIARALALGRQTFLFFSDMCVVDRINVKEYGDIF